MNGCGIIGAKTGVQTMQQKIGRNDPCPCGSGKKHKQCCLGKEAPEVRQQRLGVPIVITLIGLCGAGYLWWAKGAGSGLASVAGAILIGAVVYALREPPPPNTGGGDASAINFGK